MDENYPQRRTDRLLLTPAGLAELVSFSNPQTPNQSRPSSNDRGFQRNRNTDNLIKGVNHKKVNTEFLVGLYNASKLCERTFRIPGTSGNASLIGSPLKRGIGNDLSPRPSVLSSQHEEPLPVVTRPPHDVQQTSRPLASTNHTIESPESGLQAREPSLLTQRRSFRTIQLPQTKTRNPGSTDSASAQMDTKLVQISQKEGSALAPLTFGPKDSRPFKSLTNI